MTQITQDIKPSLSRKNAINTIAPQVHPLSKQERGFTLIEVMVALAILAVVAVAASRASSAYLNSVEVLRTRTLAHFVAQNTAAELRIEQTWLTDSRTQTVDMQGRTWQVTLIPSDSLSPALKNINIAVAPIKDAQIGAVVTDIDILLSNEQQGAGSASDFIGSLDFSTATSSSKRPSNNLATSQLGEGL